jgi:hypothetical protein
MASWLRTGWVKLKRKGGELSMGIATFLYFVTEIKEMGGWGAAANS